MTLVWMIVVGVIMGLMHKTPKTVMAAALIAASLVSPSFAQSPWRGYVEKVMRQILPKEAKCTRGIDASKCEYDTAKFKIEFYGSDGMLGAAGAIVEFRPPLTQGEQDVGKDMVFAFFKTFNFDETTIRNCIGKGFQRDQWGPEQVKNTNKEFKLECYGAGTWILVMKKNNEF